jgi:transcription elongation factor GreA
MQKIPMTPTGYQKLKDELSRLKKVDRPANIKAIEEARAHGDLSENAEYHAAKEKQSFIAGRIQELEHKIATANVVDTSKIDHDHISFGATVKLLDVDTDDEKTYTLVGPEEADIKQNKISIHSPIGKSLIRKEVGDLVTVKAPARTIEYEVLDIRFE